MKKSYLTCIYALIASVLIGYGFVQAAPLQEGSVYIMKILPGGDSAEVGQCSAFIFGDVRLVCEQPNGPLADNTALGLPALVDGNGIAGDGLAGKLTIITGNINASGMIPFVVDEFQMDPYLNTPGGIFKTTMTPPDGFLGGSGSVDALGNMTLDVTGRTGVAEYFENTIGIQPWNFDDSNILQNNGVPVTNQWEPFTTGTSSNFNLGGGINLTLTGRPIGDANSDGILDAVLVSAGNLGSSWQAFDGTPYTEAFNVQFELISTTVTVAIDIKPGSNTNPVNPFSTGKVTVAILTTNDFDASIVDADSVRFGPDLAEPTMYRIDDVDSDGDWDLKLKFLVQDTGILCGDTEGTLTAQTLNSDQIVGTDAIKTVGCM